MYQVFTLRNVRKQLVECLVVLYETLQQNIQEQLNKLKAKVGTL